MTTRQHKIFCVSDVIRPLVGDGGAACVSHSFQHCTSNGEEHLSLEPPISTNRQKPRLNAGVRGERERNFSACSPRERADNCEYYKPTIRSVFRRRFVPKPYRLQLVRALRANGIRTSVEFCDRMRQNMEDDAFLPRAIFNDEATLGLSGKGN